MKHVCHMAGTGHCYELCPVYDVGLESGENVSEGPGLLIRLLAPVALAIVFGDAAQRGVLLPRPLLAGADPGVTAGPHGIGS